MNGLGYIEKEILDGGIVLDRLSGWKKDKLVFFRGSRDVPYVLDGEMADKMD